MPFCSHNLGEQAHLFGAQCLRAAVKAIHIYTGGNARLTILHTHPTSVRVVAELIAKLNVG